MTTKAKVTGVVAGVSFLVIFSILAIYLKKEEPRNKDGYLYRDYLQWAAVVDSSGSLVFTDTRPDTFTIYMSGDTLIVETPDSLIIIPGSLPPPIPLPFDYVVKVAVGEVLLFGLTPDHFYSVYKFPPDSTGKHVWEIWEGTEPGKTGTAAVDSVYFEIVRPRELLYGWTELLPPDTVVVVDSTGELIEYEVYTFEPVSAAIFDTEDNVFVVEDSIPETIRSALRINQ